MIAKAVLAGAAIVGGIAGGVLLATPAHADGVNCAPGINDRSTCYQLLLQRMNVSDPSQQFGNQACNLLRQGNSELMATVALAGGQPPGSPTYRAAAVVVVGANLYLCPASWSGR